MDISLSYITEEALREKAAEVKKGAGDGKGRVLIVGGGWISLPSVYLAFQASLEGGANSVFVAVPKPYAGSVRSMSPDVAVIQLPDFKFTRGSAKRLLKTMPEVDAVLFTTGTERGKEDGLKFFMRECEVKKVALSGSLLSQELFDLLPLKESLIVLTKDEFEKASKVKLDEEDRAKAVCSFAASASLNLLLKDKMDYIAVKGSCAINRKQRVEVNKLGSLDALAGLAASFLSKGLSVYEAASLASYVDTEAELLAYKEKGPFFKESEVVKNYSVILKNL